jgi:hypothetical protein
VNEVEHPKKIQVAKINHINRGRFYIKLVEDCNIMYGSIRKIDKTRKIAPEYAS